MRSNQTCGRALIALLEAYGVDTVFGMPGVHTLELYQGLAASRIRHILVRHEQGAGFMADGYARASGRPGVCVVITGPGVTNTATPMGEAYSDSVPMLVLSSVNASADLGKGRGRLHEITSQEAVTAPLTAFSATAHDAAEIPELVARAFDVFSSERPRPVHIALPLDVLVEPAEFAIEARMPKSAAAPAADAVARAAELLERAYRPVIVAGGGSIEGAAALERVASRLHAPVVVTTAAKGVLRDDHPLCLGATLSLAPTQALLASADVVLAVGTELAETDSWIERLPIAGKLVRIDIDAASTERDYRAEVALVGGAGQAIEALDAAIGKSASSITDAELDGVRRRCVDDMSPLARRHMKLLARLRGALPADAMVFSDMTQIAYTGNVHYPCSVPRSWFHPNGYGTLGYALPAAIGARLAARERAVAVLVGDGGLLFTVQELATAAELALPLVIVLWNNDGLGQIRDGMIERGIPEVGVNPRNPDYQQLARAFGCNALRPDSLDSFSAAIGEALGAPTPSVIEVRQDAAWLD
ncbi:MAG: 5-guanidino-2-oxopentanoate decarboxylase [Gammaproteobacteria bacterium]|nr:5-guanidino-2-oxopentanoate decarboxylase [Gammaproteobacteria bacterium]